jgi:hypothetical protein
VRQLICPRHWLSDGTQKEFLIREFLVRHLPANLNVGHGFIRALASEDVSSEIDVLVTDPNRHVPLFNEGGLQVVAPSSVLATIEVKSTYRKAVLEEAIRKVLQVRSVALGNATTERLWSGIIFATATDYSNVRQIVSDTSSVLGDPATWQDTQPASPQHLRRLVPTVICLLDRCVLLLDSDPNSESVRVRGFEAHRASAALALAQLFSFLRAVVSAEYAPGELDAMLERVEGLAVYSEVVAP